MNSEQIPFAIVYLDISIDAIPAGHLQFELFANTPKTSEFFRQLCTGEMRNQLGQRISFVNSKFDKIIPGFIAQGGNVQGLRNEIMNFEGEASANEHDKKGLIFMSCQGENLNQSTFCINMNEKNFHLNGKYIAFGKLVKGWHTLKQIEKQGVYGKENPTKLVLVSDCGQKYDIP